MTQLEAILHVKLCTCALQLQVQGPVGRLFLGLESKEARPVLAPGAVALPQGSRSANDPCHLV